MNRISDTIAAMNYGYARVSTDGQDLAQQLAALRAAGCVQTFQEKASGANADRPQLRRAIRILEAGDVLTVTSIDRLARDTRDLLNILYDVKTAGAGFRSIAEPLVDTTSELADVVIAVLGIAAKYERGRIIERTSVGRTQAQARGVKFGRKGLLTPVQEREAVQRMRAGDTQRTIASSMRVSQATISRLAVRERSLQLSREAAGVSAANVRSY